MKDQGRQAGSLTELCEGYPIKSRRSRKNDGHKNDDENYFLIKKSSFEAPASTFSFIQRGIIPRPL